MSACNDVPISESFEQIKLQIADLVNQAGGLPKPQVQALLQELLQLLLDEAEYLGLDVQRVLQLAIDADTLRKT